MSVVTYAFISARYLLYQNGSEWQLHFNFCVWLQVDPNTGVSMYESDDIIKYLVGKYGVCGLILLQSLHFMMFIVYFHFYSICRYDREYIHNATTL